MGLQSKDELSHKTTTSSASHFNDWPNDIGFETDFVQNNPIELKISGNIPAYAAGTLYRTGPGTRSVDCDNGKHFEAIHWFDGFNVVHRFQIKVENEVKVFYSSRSTADRLIEHIRKTGRFKDFGFAQKRDPCQSFFKKLMSFFQPEAGLDPEATNIGVAMTPNMPGISAAVSKDTIPTSNVFTITTRTDAAKYQILDPSTLEPVGVCNQSTLNPELKGAISGTHAKTCPLTGDVFNYNLEVGKKSFYRIFQACAATGETRILATVEAPPAYLHSIFLTENTVVLCVWNSHFAYRGLSILYHRNVLDAIAPLDEKEPARWFVVDRSPARKGLLATYHTPAFFCFHTINAYEEPSETEEGRTDIIADLITYTDLSVLHRFYYNNLLSTSADAVNYIKQREDNFRGNLSRYRLPAVPLPSLQPKLKSKITTAASTSSSRSSTLFSSSPFYTHHPTIPRPAHLIYQAPKSHTLELPTLSPLHITRKHRYHYGVSDTGLSTFFDGIGKYDAHTQTAKFWRKEGHTPGEPIFVPSDRARAAYLHWREGEREREREAESVTATASGGEGEEKEEEEEEEEQEDTDGEGDWIGGFFDGEAKAGGEYREDDGVLLSVVLDGKKGESYLLVLDAGTMRQVGRAEMAGSLADGERRDGAEGVGVKNKTPDKDEGVDSEGSKGDGRAESQKTDAEGKRRKMVVGIGFHGLHVPEGGGLASGGE